MWCSSSCSASFAWTILYLRIVFGRCSRWGRYMLSHELHRQRRGALERLAAAEHVLDPGTKDPLVVERAVLIEAAILDRDRCLASDGVGIRRGRRGCRSCSNGRSRAGCRRPRRSGSAGAGRCALSWQRLGAESATATTQPDRGQRTDRHGAHPQDRGHQRDPPHRVAAFAALVSIPSAHKGTIGKLAGVGALHERRPRQRRRFSVPSKVFRAAGTGSFSGAKIAVDGQSPDHTCGAARCPRNAPRARAPGAASARVSWPGASGSRSAKRRPAARSGPRSPTTAPTSTKDATQAALQPFGAAARVCSRKRFRPRSEVAALNPDELTETLLASLRFTAFPDVHPALTAARSHGRRLVVVSNWDISLVRRARAPRALAAARRHPDFGAGGGAQALAPHLQPGA